MELSRRSALLGASATAIAAAMPMAAVLDLPDYEEGTFTPVAMNPTGTRTWTLPPANYVRIGTRIVFEVDMNFEGRGGIKICGLPFATA